MGLFIVSRLFLATQRLQRKHSAVFLGLVAIRMLQAATPPVFTTQPQSISVGQDRPATFRAAATGTPMPTYQWQRYVSTWTAFGTKSSWSNIPGATAATYVTPNTVASDNGAKFRVVANNGSGIQATSNTAVLTLSTYLQITSQPVSQTVEIGQTATFTVQARGNPAPRYQWYKGVSPFVAIPGANNPSYTTEPAVGPASNAQYCCVVSSPDPYPYLQASNYVSLSVATSPQITSFTASPTQIWSGQSAWVTPTFVGGSAKIGTSGPNSGQVAASVASGVSRSVTPPTTTTYTLTVTNALGRMATQDARVAVETHAPSITTFTTSRSLVDFGTPVSLAWTLGAVPSALTLNGASVLGQTSATVTPSNRHKYTLVSRNPLGPDATATLQVAARGMDLLVGDAGSFGDLDGQGSAARFGSSLGQMATDGQGNVFVADSDNFTIRKITPGGLVTTIAGQPGVSGYLEGPAASAKFQRLSGLAMDGTGNLYVCHGRGSVVRKVTSSGLVYTLAGVADSPGANDGPGATARFSAEIYGLAVDVSGVVYLADTRNYTIRKIMPDGTVSTLAGLAGERGHRDGTGTAARFELPYALALDGLGNLFVADVGDYTIRKINLANGAVTTLAGRPGVPGYQDGPGSSALFWGLEGLAVGSDGALYGPEPGNHTIRKIEPWSGNVSSLLTRSGGGYLDGPLWTARTEFPMNIAAHHDGTLTFSDRGRGTVRKIQGEMVSTLAGAPLTYRHLDGPAEAAKFFMPTAITTSAQGTVFLTEGASVRKMADGVVSTYAGEPDTSSALDGEGPAAGFRGLGAVANIAVDRSGILYVPDYFNHTIRKVAPSGAQTPYGTVTTLAGQALAPGASDGTGPAARFNGPRGVVAGQDGNLYVTDSENQLLRKVTPSGAVTTVAGSIGEALDRDGSLAMARFNVPKGIVQDGAGNLLVSTKTCIRKVSPTGQVTTLAGAPTPGDADGTGSAARFNEPTALALDASGNVFVLDQGNSLVRKITPSGVVTTLAGTRGRHGTFRGRLPGVLEQSGATHGLAFTPQGDLLVTTEAGIWQITAP